MRGSWLAALASRLLVGVASEDEDGRQASDGDERHEQGVLDEAAASVVTRPEANLQPGGQEVEADDHPFVTSDWSRQSRY